MVKKTSVWLPDRQDIIWIDCNPLVGQEIRYVHLFLVLSPQSFNDKTSLVIGLLMTTVSYNSDNPFAVAVGKARGCKLEKTSYVLCHQPKSFDWRICDAKPHPLGKLLDSSLMTSTDPVIQCFNNAKAETDFIVTSLKELPEASWLKSCIAVRRLNDMERYKAALTEANIPFYQIDQNTVDNAKHSGVRIATMHRVKGLEFDYMYVAGVNEGVVPLNYLDSDDVTVIREHEQKERSLLYVAITRAKRFCAITGFGQFSGFMA